MLFRKALLSDLKECFGVIEAARGYMLQQGIDQWDELYPEISDVEEDIRLNQLRVGVVDNRIVVIYALNEMGEGYEIGDWEYDLPYYVVHRLCVHPDYQGKHVARSTLKQIVKEALLAGKEALRLDVFSLNPAALCLYEHFGFKKTGEISYRKGIFYLMEMKLCLETDRVVLRKGKMEDYPFIWKNVWCHEETAKYMQWNVTLSEDEAKSRMMRTINWQKEHDTYFIYDKRTGEPIGFAGVDEIGDSVVSEAGIALGPMYVHQGVGKEVLKCLIDYARFIYEAKVFVCFCNKENEASKALIKACGGVFVSEEEVLAHRDGKPYVLQRYEMKLGE